MHKIVAIHQPNFFPWLGYFHKILNAQWFIVLDDIQLPRGRSWTSRVKFLISGEAKWLTAPVRHVGEENIQSIKDAQWEGLAWKEKACKTVYNNYKKTANFAKVYSFFEKILFFDSQSLLEFNLNAITAIVEFMGASTEHIIQSSRFNIHSTSTQRLIDLTRAVHGNVYMCGGGAQGYQNDALFEQQGLSLLYQNFRHPVYPQRGQESFVAGLSILDAFFQVGPVATRKMLKGE